MPFGEWHFEHIPQILLQMFITLLKKGYYFLYHPIEKGGLTIEIETDSDFDPKKLTLVGTKLVMPKNKGIYISSLDYEGGNVIEGDGFGDGDFTDTHWVEFFKV